MRRARAWRPSRGGPVEWNTPPCPLGDGTRGCSHTDYEEVALAAHEEIRIASVEIRQHGRIARISLRTQRAHDTVTLVVASDAGEDLVFTPTGVGTELEFEIDLATLVRVEPTLWVIEPRVGARHVDWLSATWTIPDRVLWGEDETPVTLSVIPGEPDQLVALAGVQDRPSPKLTGNSIKSTKTGLAIASHVRAAPHPWDRIELLMTERNGDHVIVLPVTFTTPRRHRGMSTDFRISTHVAWADLDVHDATEYLDIALVLYAGDVATEPTRIVARGGMLGRLRRLHAGSVVTELGGMFFEPRYTFKARALSIYVAHLEAAAVRELRTATRFVLTKRWLYRRRHAPVWLVGELPYKAQDTGLAFFTYMRAEHPHIDTRYVVRADSPDLGRALAVGPVVLHGTAEHVRLTLIAERVLGSHHPDYLFPVRVASFRRKVPAVLVFLQHGVMGTKWMANLYGRSVGGFHTDLFIVSSPRERALIIRDFGYEPAQVAVTGLSRFDQLLDGTPASDRILVIPTWRDWIASPEAFAESEFRAQWMGLVTNPAFLEAVVGREVLVILHPNFRRYAEDFEAPGVTVLRQGEETVQDLLKSSAMVITDYSSVGFDFALQHRPVVYFQFDREAFLGKRGSHLDLDVDLPGAVVVTVEAAISAVKERARSGFTQKAEDGVLADSYFPMRDRHSNDRIYAAALAARRTRPNAVVRNAQGAVRMVAAGVRGSRLNRYVVRGILLAGRLLPIRRRVVVFESNLGRSYGDSPRAIYRELIRTHPELKPVWASAVAIPDASKRTMVVKRLSWMYFWQLSRAGYWVNNQSFPHYVARRRSQVFVQTWHGTPLKRMLNDVEDFAGRDPGYRDRATRASAQWSVLTSPNPHTTAAMASAFGHKARVLEVGYPRNDIFYQDDAAELAARVRRQLGVADGKRIVLFAPTFRDAAMDGQHRVTPTEAIEFDAFAERFGHDAVLAVRRHVLDEARARIPAHLRENIVDATAIPDVQELMLATDVLVTDYSSLYVDFLNLRRPCIFFAPDLEEYRDELRGFYLDYGKDLPGPVTTTSDACLDAVASALADGELAEYDLAAFAALYCPHDDGHAAQRVVADVWGSGGA